MVMAAVGWGVETWNRARGWPLGSKILDGPVAAKKLTGLVLVAWPLSLLSARFAAQWLLARARAGSNPGLRLWLVAATLALIPQTAIDLFCRRVWGAYEWSQPRCAWEGIVFDWLPGLWLAHLLALAGAVPALLDKRPVPSLPPVGAFLLWVGWNLLWLGACWGRVAEATLAAVLAPFTMVTLWAFRNGYPARG
ncbi:MAG: hypothetical protein N2438_01875 [Limisphaera sp.]|nr:hypothetical protein [Limisphaera sp.]